MQKRKITFQTRLLSNFYLFFKPQHRKSAMILLYAVLAMVTWKTIIVPDAVFESQYDNATFPPFFLFLLGSYKILLAFLLFGMIPLLIVRFVFHEKIADYGLQLGKIKRGGKIFLCMIPVMIAAAWFAGKTPEFLNVYPYNRVLLEYYPAFFPYHAVLYLFYYFGWEFFFRGFVQNGLKKPFGLGNAILIQTLASTLLHFGNPETEVWGSIVAGFFWGIIAYRTRSILSGFLQHSLLGIVLDWLLINHS